MSIFIALHLLEYPAYLDYTLPPKLTMEIGEIIVC
jgi:hypothetical protein